MVKSILENIVAYWLSLSKVLRSILNAIRRMMFDFVWASNQQEFKFQLVKWKILASPKDKGGRALKNLFKFSLALRARSLWLATIGGSLWTKVLQAKIFKKISSIQWIRCSKKSQKSVSNFWYDLIDAFELFGNCLS